MGTSRLRTSGIVAALALILTGCPDTPQTEPIFPSDYASTYTEVRNCRQSGDHDLHIVRVVADPIALAAYSMRDRPFPEGATVIKEEYDFGDTRCEGEIIEWTVMRKLPTGSSTDTLDWTWQTVDPMRFVLDQNEASCIGCHQRCGVPPDGYDGTCTIP